MTTLLLFSDSVSEAKRFCAKSRSVKVVVVTTLPRLEKELLEEALSVTVFQSDYPIGELKDEAIEQLRQIESKLAESNRDYPSYLYEWGTNIEGGYRTQRLLYFVGLFKEWRRLIDWLNPARIVIGRVNKKADHMRCLKTLGTEKAVTLSFLNRNVLSVSIDWETKSIMVTTRKRFFQFFGFHYAVNMVTQIRLFLNVVYPSPDVRLKNLTRNNRQVVGFSLFSHHRKHVDNIRPVQQELEKRGIEIVVFCWNSKKNIKVIQNEMGGVEVQLERFISVPLFLKVWRHWWRTKMPENIVEWLRPEIVRFRHRDTFVHLMVFEIYRSILPTIKLAAFKPYGGTFFHFGRIPAKQLNLISPSTVVFHYALGADFGPDFSLPLQKNEVDHLDILFLEGKTYIPYYTSVCTRASVVPCGYSRLYLLNQKKKANRSAQSLLKNILFVSAGVSKFVYTKNESRHYMDTLIQLSKKYGQYNWAVKLHPSENPDLVHEAIATHHPGENFQVLKGTDDPYEAINQADIVLSKFSTMLSEAALMGNVAVSVGLKSSDFEALNRAFGGFATVLNGVEALYQFFQDQVENPEHYPQWREAYLQRTAQNLSHRLSTDRVPEQVICDTVCEKLKRNSQNERPSDDRVD